ncbi:flagellar biosynthetic protein FliR [Desulfitispora alkaliphila]|uniref:flagellar biosynthetic protein FliR n=1 Tax=Desulfitispora alkaliphila TaxID=622674 RepID=UPI003D1BF1E3
MEVIQYWMGELEQFMFIWARIGGMFLIAPVFSGRNIPVLVKVGLSGMIAFVSMFAIPALPVPDHIALYAFGIAGEMLIGFIIGFFIQVFFSAIQLAGQLIDMQMGFYIVNVIDPEHGIQVPLIGHFKNLLALVIFLTIDGHHLLLQAVVNSYKFIPLAGLRIDESFVLVIIDLMRGMFITSLQIGAPIVGALFISSLALGIVARTVPQMNVFVVGMPAKIGAGFLMLIISLPLYVYFMSNLFGNAFSRLDGFIKMF